jgi:hypothetical protein
VLRFFSPGEQVPALWRPAALRTLPSGALLIAEMGSRRLLRLDPDGQKHTLFDAEPGRADAGYFEERQWNESFGVELVLLRDGSVLLASLGGPLRHFDLERATVSEWGGQQALAEGVALAQAELSSLAGLAYDAARNELWLAAGDRLWLARMQDGAQATLQLKAGNGARGQGERWVEALQTPLDLPRWSAMAIDDDGGVLFQEKERFRYLRDDRVLTLCGDGGKLDAAPLALADFSGRLLPSLGVARWHQGRFYVMTGSSQFSVRKLETTLLDMQSGSVEGTISTIVPYGLSELRSFDFDAETLLLSYGWAGSVLELVPGARDFEARYGPINGRVRYRILEEEHTPYRLDAVMRPQSLLSLSAGELVMLHQPLISLLSSINRAQPEQVDPFFAVASGGVYGFGAMASDNRYDMVLASGFNLEWIELSPTGEGRYRSYQRFFGSWRDNGIPGHALDARLLPQAKLAVTDSGPVWWSPGAEELLRLDTENAWLRVETGPRFGRSLPESLEQDVSYFGLDLATASAFAAEGSWRAVVVEHPFGEGEVLLASHQREAAVDWAGQPLEPKKYRIVLGSGEASFAEAVAATDLGLRRIEALDWWADGEMAGAFVAAEDLSGSRLLSSMDASGSWRRLEGTCAQPPEEVDELVVLGVWGQAMVLVQAGAELWACATSEGLCLGAFCPTASRWLLLAPGIEDLARSPSGDAAAWLERSGRVSVAALSSSAQALTQVEVSFGERALDAHDLAWGEQVLYLWAQSEDEGSLWVSALGASSQWPRLPGSKLLAGLGSGQSREAPMSTRSIGLRPAAMALAANADLYLAMSDSQTVWRYVAGENEELDPDDNTILLWQGAPLFTGAEDSLPMALSPSGRLCIGSSGRVYALEDGRMWTLLGGGSLWPDASVASGHWELGEIRGLAFLGETLYVLSARGLFATGAQGDARIVSEDGKIRLADGRLMSTDIVTTRQPQMVAGRTNELLLVDPATHELVRVPCEPEPMPGLP